MNRGPVGTAFTGPLLREVVFEEVLVAKAVSHSGEDLELVLYNNGEAGVFDLGFGRLVAGREYKWEGGNFVAGNDGTGTLKVSVDGRTRVLIEPVV